MNFTMRISAFLLTFVLCGSALSQSLPAGISPQMIQQLQSLPPAQQQALAKQYGITLPATGGTTVDTPTLGQRGEELQPVYPERMLMNFDETDDVEKSEEVESKARIRFGRRLFDREVSTFAPTDDAPVPDEYRLGVGDQLVISLFGKENEQFNLQIGRDGSVAFPRLGVITLSGLTFEDARDLIKTRVEQALIGVEAVVSMGRLRAISIFMAGEVQVPGAYSVSALTTVTQALFQAGGVTDIGSLRNIQVKRGSKLVGVFDAYDLLMRGDASNDLKLRSGDVVFVPPYAGVAEVQGEVKRPMVYELSGDENLAELVQMAGSYTQQAFPSLAVLTRTPDDGGLTSAISLNLYDEATQAIPVVNGDVLRVPKSGQALANSVTLTGAVNRPGEYGWFEGMRVSNLLNDVRRDLLREADLSYALKISYENKLLDIEVEQFSLLEAINNPSGSGDLELQEFDEIIVFSLPELEELDAEEDDASAKDESRNAAGKVTALDVMDAAALQSDEEDEEEGARDNSREALLKPIIDKLTVQARENEPVQTVSITGAVRVPAVYPLTENATVSDLIAAAGGLKDSAYLESSEFRRLIETPGGEVSASYTEIDLNEVLSGRQPIELSSRDHLTVRDIPDWNPNDQITVNGEVVFPGTYLIQPGETLSDVITRAGGLTVNAFAEGAVFTREEIAKRESDRARSFAAEVRQTYASRLLTEETTSSTLSEITEITQMLEDFEGRGRMLIDLPLAMSESSGADVVVTDGDSLFVPKRTKTVTVVGEVYQQGTHSFDASSDLKDYLNYSAGLTKRADSEAIYIVRANGSVIRAGDSWWRFNDTTQQLSPGDTIVVPVNTQYKESLASWREITQIVYQSLISIAAVSAL